MKKLTTINALLITGFIVCLFVAFKYFTLEFSDSAEYTEKDIIEYKLYTHDLLKNVPRISGFYKFSYSNMSGPNPALIYRAKFFGTTDTKQISTYLKKRGYIKESMCNLAGSCWSGKKLNETVLVSVENNPNAVQIEIIEKIQ